MEKQRRELIVARICSGTIRLKLLDGIVIVRASSPNRLYEANELYQEVFDEALLNGMWDDDGLYGYLLEQGLWDEESQSLLLKLPNEIEEWKVKLFEQSFQENEMKIIRNSLQLAKAKHAELIEKRHSYDHLCASGIANMSRIRYLIEEFDDNTEDIILEMHKQRISEAEIREVARTEPWRNIWTCRKSGDSIFQLPIISYTEEQRQLVSWSQLLDNIYEHPDCPPADVIEDDDRLDGWLIKQRRKRDEKQKINEVEGQIKSDKIKNSQEVFVIADNIKSAKKIYDVNSEHSKAVLKQRFNYLKKHGTVAEQDMPDTKQKIMMEQVKLSMKGPG